jgi:hypothetical protein
VVKKPMPTPQEFEAAQVERLKNLFKPAEAAAPTTPTAPSAPKANDSVVTQAAEPAAGISNPFGEDDADPVGIPAQVVEIRDQITSGAPDALKPFVREGVEQAYRGTQMIPWVNAIVPISKIVPQIGDALGGDKEASLLRLRHRRRPGQPGIGRHGTQGDRLQDRVELPRPARAPARTGSLRHRGRQAAEPRERTLAVREGRRRRVRRAERPSSGHPAREAFSLLSSRGTDAWAHLACSTRP